MISNVLKPLLGLALASLAAPLIAASTVNPPLHTTALPAGLSAALHQALASGTRPALPTGDVLAWIEQKVVADDGIVDDAFGFSVAIDGNTALVSAAQGSAAGSGNDNGGAGAVYVFTKAGSTWTQTQKLTADDGVDNDQFGYSVALSGTTALVGSVFAAVGDNTNQGAVYVFSNAGGTWTQTQKLTSDDGVAGDQLGWSVAIDGDLALLGAPQTTIGGNQGQGAVYAFTQSGGSWTQTAKLSTDDGAFADLFGFSIALQGTTAVISAPNATIGANANQGAAYVFTLSDASWTQGPKLFADDGAATENFGYSVAFDGTTALIGAPFATVGDNMFQGAVYAFDGTDGNWAQAQKLVTAEGAGFDVLGIAVSLSDNSAVITAPFYNGSQGEAFLFSNPTGAQWTEQHTFVASDAVPGAGEGFGYTATIAHGTVLIGAALAPVGANDNQGAAYFYASDRIFADGFDPAP